MQQDHAEQWVGDGLSPVQQDHAEQWVWDGLSPLQQDRAEQAVHLLTVRQHGELDSGDDNLLRGLVEALKAGRRIFVAGAAGTGKTFLVRRIARQLAASETVTHITASTGVAASLLFDEVGERQSLYLRGPSTVHSAAAIPWSSERDMPERVTVGRRKMRSIDVLVIDEISMLDGTAFSRLLKRLPKRAGILAVGDFLQLEPVGRDIRGRPDYAFRKRAFRDFEMVELVTNHRQSEGVFLNFLERLRKGEADRAFYANISQDFDPRFPVLFGTKKEVHLRNAAEMAKIQAPAFFSRCRVQVGAEEAALKWFDDYARALRLLEIKVGMRVMCVQNMGFGGRLGLVNGDLGTVREVTAEDPEGTGPNWVRVAFDRLNGDKIVPPYRFEKRNEYGEVIYAVQQMPLIPAYALTVHKAQGLTLDCVNIDGKRINFAAGQVYVAVSRCRTMAGLRIRNSALFEPFTRPSVQRYYARAKRFPT